MRSRHLARAAPLLAAGAAVAGYASVVERNWFVLREMEVPVLPDGARPVRVLHLSDVHLTPGRARLLSWLRSLDATEPDLVVNTGDSIAHTGAVRPFLDALGPLLDRPGVFVYGSNDLYSPVPKNPTRYLWRTSPRAPAADPDLPWAELGEGMAAAGWLDLNNRRGRVKAGELDIEVAGTHDSHIRRDRYERSPAPPTPRPTCGSASCTRPSRGCSTGSSPTAMTCCSPGTPTAARCACPGSGRWSPTAASTGPGHAASAATRTVPGPAWLHVSAGLGTSPWAPFRLCCRPEATLLTLTPRMH